MSKLTGVFFLSTRKRINTEISLLFPIFKGETKIRLS